MTIPADTILAALALGAAVLQLVAAFITVRQNSTLIRILMSREMVSLSVPYVLGRSLTLARARQRLSERPFRGKTAKVRVVWL